jgi:two-component system, OmpR family, osmolarity sensor histidine kinase EnvZ
MHWCSMMLSLKRTIGRILPGTLYARFFWLQLLLLGLITLTFFALFAMNQTRSAMTNIADVWAPAIQKSLLLNAPTGDETITVSRQVELLRATPPADAYAPNWTHLRWSALMEALRARNVPVSDLMVSGRTGEAIVWFNTGDEKAPRWIGVRSNLEGADFPARWMIAMSLSFIFIGIAAWWLSRKITTPLRNLESSVEAFSAGKPFVAQSQNAPGEVRTLIGTFERMAREREDLDAQRALMLAGISHDIRSPLARIRMAAELLPKHDDVEALYKRIVRNIGIADGLIESFSDYVRAESEPMNQRINIVELAKALATTTEVEFIVSPSTESIWVLGSEHLLQRALGNLIDNAKQHGRPPVVVYVEVSAAGNEIRVSVNDRGDGIPSQDRERLLRPFERGSTARETAGSGLGLAITMRAAQRHGGRLEIIDNKGGGTACVLVLPKAT